MERKIGETFNFNDIVLQVCKEPDLCVGCFLRGIIFNVVILYSAGEREDKTGIIFKEVRD